MRGKNFKCFLMAERLLVYHASAAGINVKSSVSMKKQNESNTMSSMQSELQCLLSSADNLLRLFKTRAALSMAEGANRTKAGRMGAPESGLQ
jgi:hypothetical protein